MQSSACVYGKLPSRENAVQFALEANNLNIYHSAMKSAPNSILRNLKYASPEVIRLVSDASGGVPPLLFLEIIKRIGRDLKGKLKRLGDYAGREFMQERAQMNNAKLQFSDLLPIAQYSVKPEDVARLVLEFAGLKGGALGKQQSLLNHVDYTTKEMKHLDELRHFFQEHLRMLASSKHEALAQFKEGATVFLAMFDSPDIAALNKMWNRLKNCFARKAAFLDP